MAHEIFTDPKLNGELMELQLAQEPVSPGMPRHPKRKRAYFEALAKAWEEGRLLPVEVSE